jgi:hypothetical protein
MRAIPFYAMMSSGGMPAPQPVSISLPNALIRSSSPIITAEVLMALCWNGTRPQSIQTMRRPSRRAQTEHRTILSDARPQIPQTISFLRDLLRCLLLMLPPFFLN